MSYIRTFTCVLVIYGQFSVTNSPWSHSAQIRGIATCTVLCVTYLDACVCIRKTEEQLVLENSVEERDCQQLAKESYRVHSLTHNRLQYAYISN